MPDIVLYPCAHCQVLWPVWDLELIDRRSNGTGIYICGPCHS